MKSVKIGSVYVGSFWIGTPEQIEETQRAIDEEISIYCEDENNGDKGKED